MIKLIVSDLDGTLLTRNKDVLEKDKEALKLATNSGVEFAIATGRMDIEILKVLDITGQKGHRISQNGGFVYSKDGEELFSYRFSPKLALSLYDFLSSTGEESAVTVFAESQAYVREKSERLEAIKDQLFFPIEIEPNLLEKMEQEIVTSKMTVNGDTDALKDLEKQVNEKFGSELDTFISDPHCLDLMPKNINKGRSVKDLIDLLHIKPDEIACVGDSFNDISMFELTPHSYAMSHGEAAVKNHASYEVNNVHEMISHLVEQNIIKQ
jgi:Cof subfamily protein (haloacid dehalogenase superfamily)